MMTRMSTHEDGNFDVPVGKPRHHQLKVNKNHGFSR